MNTKTLPDFYFNDLQTNVQQALKEDIGTGDLTAHLIPEAQQAIAHVICREDAVICGRPWFDAVMKAVDAQLEISWFCKEGDKLTPNQPVCQIKGQATSILTAERSALNFLQTLSGTATTTALYVKALGQSNTKLLDTRKTLPGLRLAQKYAVYCGGGTNHRIGLYDAILIKENHIMASGGLIEAVSKAKQKHPNIQIEVETESLTEVSQALKAKADIIMLDNFSIENMKQAVILNQKASKPAKLEISGNVEIQNLPGLGKIGVDFISTGAITKHCQSIDFSMRFGNYSAYPLKSAISALENDYLQL